MQDPNLLGKQSTQFQMKLIIYLGDRLNGYGIQRSVVYTVYDRTWYLPSPSYHIIQADPLNVQVGLVSLQ